jgi:hypothetical protein
MAELSDAKREEILAAEFRAFAETAAQLEIERVTAQRDIAVAALKFLQATTSKFVDHHSKMQRAKIDEALARIAESGR